MRNLKRNVDVIVGLQAGDEGKGKIINELCESYDCCVRFQGGANSGHTVYDRNGNKVVFNVVPSGMLNDQIKGVITGGVVINPLAFTQEIDRISPSIHNIGDRLFLSKDINITLPSHILIDIFTEKARYESGAEIIGSTNRGNTPTYTDKVARRGMRLSDLGSPDFMSKYNKLTQLHLDHIVKVLGADPAMVSTCKIGEIPFIEYELLWLEACKDMCEFMITDTVSLLHEIIHGDNRVLLEGAQGLMLDIDYGTYPYVTSTSVTASAAFAQTGIPVQCVGRVYGVMKPYVTRVGSGFFPTQIVESDENWKTAEKIVDTGKEFGSVTGRRRKIGWLDLPQIKYACMVNGVTDLILMKCDVLSELPDDFLVAYNYTYLGMESDAYSGEDLFESVQYQQFKQLGKIGNDNFGDGALSDLIAVIDAHVSDVITSPRISIVSMSATEKAVKI